MFLKNYLLLERTLKCHLPKPLYVIRDKIFLIHITYVFKLRYVLTYVPYCD